MSDELIPTVSKWRLSGLLSYVLGAKHVSEGLRGVPQYDRLSLIFWPQNENPHEIESPFWGVRVHYSKPRPGHSASRDVIESGWYDGRWEIRVGAVPRGLRHAAKALLLEEGLPQIRTWLCDLGDVTGREGHAWFQCDYDAERERLVFEDRIRLR